MNSKVRALVAFILLANLFVAQAIVPVAIGLAEAGLIVAGALAGAGIEYWFFLKPAQDRIAELEASASSNLLATDSYVKYDLKEKELSVLNQYYILYDMSQYSKNYVWGLVKYTALKAKSENKTLAEATSLVGQALDEYYKNVTLNVLYAEKDLLTSVAGKLDFWTDSGAFDSNSSNRIYLHVPDVDGYGARTFTFQPTFSGSSNSVYAGPSSGGSSYWHTAKLINGNFSDGLYITAYSTPYGSFNRTQMKVLDIVSGSNSGYLYPDRISVADVGEIYNKTIFDELLNRLVNDYNYFSSNAANYVNAIYNNDVTYENLVDPYLLATFLSTDYNSTGYYGYYAAEMALMGLPTNLNSSFTIQLDDGTTLSGMLFADYLINSTGANTTVIKVNGTYTVPAGGLVFFVDENGNLYKLAGNFTVTGLYDQKTGNPLNETQIVKYVDHSGDIQKIYDELDKLYTLWQKYLEMQTITGGGTSGSSNLSEWWASLDQTAKIGVIAIGAVGVYAILGRRK